MRVLTVRQPWAWAIIHGGKDVENRVRNIAGTYRGPVAIHAGQRYDDDWQSAALDDAMRPHRNVPSDQSWTPPWKTNLGSIIGVVDLVDVHTADDTEQTRHLKGLWPVCSRWAERAGFHLKLTNPRALDEPIPWKGALGLRNSDLFVSGDWLGQYADPGHSSCTPYGCPPSCLSEPVARLVATA